MGLTRKMFIASTGGMGALFVRPSSKKERVAKAAEKSLRLQRQQATTERQILASNRQTTTPVASRPQRPSLVAELERLQSLRTQGALSEEEFLAAKRRLIYS